MKPHDCTELNDAQCLHADHFFASLAHWRDNRGLSDQMCIRIARGNAQRKYPLDDEESAVIDEYLRVRVEVRKWTGSSIQHYVEPIKSLFEVQ
ncbi:MAG TPA: hypothetical protein VIQ24_11750 [Pyrinomonadaceae bacterium]